MPIEQEVHVYTCSDGSEPFTQWLRGLRDGTTRNRIRQRIARVRLGNFGDTRSVGDGVYELRIHFGPGYRVYFGRCGDEVVILLCGGDKGSQDRDIERAREYWRDYRSQFNG
jgi:putative addiction module killer protein